MFNKSKVNFVIDALMFLSMMAIAGLGFLMKYVLIPGKDVWVKYGNVDLSLLGMDRHDWGKIHLILGFVLLGLLTLHIILHWKMILGMFRKLIGIGRAKIVIASIFTIICIILAVFPFIVNPDITKPESEGLGREEGEGRHRIEHSSIEETEIEYPEMILPNTTRTIHSHTHRHAGNPIEIKGYMTLLQAAEKYQVPFDYLKKHLNTPKTTPAEVRFSLLRKRYNFRMSDVERIIDEYHKSH